MRWVITAVGLSVIASVSVLVSVVFAGPAFAGTAAVSGSSYVTYTAAPGERNDLTVTASLEGVTFDDAGASVTAGRGCDQLGSHSVRCSTHGEHPNASALMGDEDDVVRAAYDPGATTTFSISGGPGDDSLHAAARGAILDGGPGADTLEGGAGNDILVGGAGPDSLVGGGGSDDITPDGDGAPPAADVVDGGPGSDSVSYGDRTTPVDVDLERPGGNGGPAENDTIIGVENVRSGSGSDHLRGDDGPNVIFSTGSTLGQTRQHDVVSGRGGDDQIEGSPGADVLSGGAGGDAIEGGGGADTLSGGPGDDGIALLDGSAPRSLHCGPGDDLVNYPLLRELVRPDCETVQVDGVFFLVRTRLGRAGGGVRTVDISGFRALLSEELPCRVVALLSRPRHPAGSLGRGAVRLPPKPRDRATLRVKLTAAGRRVFGSPKPVRVLLGLEGHASCRATDRNVDSGAGGFTLLSR